RARCRPAAPPPPRARGRVPGRPTYAPQAGHRDDEPGRPAPGSRPGSPRSVAGLQLRGGRCSIPRAPGSDPPRSQRDRNRLPARGPPRRAAGRPAAMLSVIAPVNEVIDLHATRVAATEKRLPPLVLVSLIASSMLAVWATGYGAGIAGPRHVPLTFALTI